MSFPKTYASAELANQLSVVVKAYLQNPSLLEDIRQKVILPEKAPISDCGFFFPYLEQAVRAAIAQFHFGESLCAV